MEREISIYSSHRSIDGNVPLLLCRRIAKMDYQLESKMLNKFPKKFSERFLRHTNFVEKYVKALEKSEFRTSFFRRIFNTSDIDILISAAINKIRESAPGEIQTISVQFSFFHEIVDCSIVNRNFRSAVVFEFKNNIKLESKKLKRYGFQKMMTGLYCISFSPEKIDTCTCA